MKYTVLIAIFLMNFNSFSQNRNVIGIAMFNTKEIPLLKVVFIDSNDRIICGNTTDLDGIFRITQNQEIKNVKYIVGMSQCTINDTIRDFDLQSDTLRLNFEIKEIKCVTNSYKDCPNHDQFCEVYRAADLLYRPYDQIENEVKNDLNQNIPIKYRKAVYTQNGCCLNKWYCKTHDVDF